MSESDETDVVSSPITKKGTTLSPLFTAKVKILRDQFKEMVGFTVDYFDRDEAGGQPVYVDEERMLTGVVNAAGERQEGAMRILHFSNWQTIPGRVIVQDGQRITREVEGVEKSFVSGFTWLADDLLIDADYLGLRMIEGMFMPKGEGYPVVKGDAIVVEQFDTAYYFMTPHSETREITAIRDPMKVFPVVAAFYIASGNNQFPDFLYRDGLDKLAQWYEFDKIPIEELLEGLWTLGPRRWMPLFPGLARVFGRLKLTNVEDAVYRFYRRHEEISARLYAVRLLGAMESGLADQRLEHTIRPQLAEQSPVHRFAFRLLEAIKAGKAEGLLEETLQSTLSEYDPVRLLAARLQRILTTGAAEEDLEPMIRQQLVENAVVVEDIETQLERSRMLRSYDKKGYAPIVGLNKLDDVIMTNIRNWWQFGSTLIPFWARDYTQLAWDMLVSDQKQYALGESRILGCHKTRFEQDFTIDGHGFTMRFTPDLEALVGNIDLLEQPTEGKHVHHKFGSLQLTRGKDRRWHIIAMRLIRLDHTIENPLKYVLLVMAFQYIRFLQGLTGSDDVDLIIDPEIFTHNPNPFDIVTLRRLGIVPETEHMHEIYDFKSAKAVRYGGRMMTLRYIEVPAFQEGKPPLIIFIEGPEQHTVIIDPAIYDEVVRVPVAGEKASEQRGVGLENQKLQKLIRNKPVEVVYYDEDNSFAQSKVDDGIAAGKIMIPIGAQRSSTSFTINSVLISGVPFILKIKQEFQQTMRSLPAIDFEGLNRER